MTHAAKLGQELAKQAGFLGRTGELTTLLMNRLTGKGKLGREMLNWRVHDRLSRMQKRYGDPAIFGDPAQLGNRLAGRNARLDRVAGRARNSRMEGIGAGVLGLGLGGAAVAATQADQA